MGYTTSKICLCLFIIICCFILNCKAASIHAWDFRSQNTNNFVDTGSGTQTNFSVSTNYIDNSYGVHLAYEKLSLTTADIFNDEILTIYGEYYASLTTNYYLFCEQNGATDRFCFSVTPAGNYAVTLTNSAGTTATKTTSITAQSGYNFFYIKMDISFGYTDITVNVVNQNYSPVKQSGQLQFEGSYTKSSQTFNLGCKVVNSVCTSAFLGSVISLTIDDTVVTDATLDALYDTTCSNDGLISCSVCPVTSGTGKCLEVYETTPQTTYLKLDISSTTTSSTTVSDLSGDSHTFDVSSSAPYRIPEQGYRFANGRYLKAQTAFVLPNSFTVNLWFRVDTNDLGSAYIMQYLYLKRTSAGVDKFYIGLTNSFLRIYIDGATYDYSHSFSTNSNWRYLSVSFYKISTLATNVQIFLDSTKLSTQSIYNVFTDNAAYEMFVGLNFEGNIYSFEISPILNVHLSTPNLLFTGSCTAYGSTSSCTVCPRTSTTAGTCLSGCGLGTYDNSCSACKYTCKYCTAAGDNCITCGSALDGSGSAPVTCTCRPGYYDNTTSCVACDSLCGTCSASGSTSCLTCANNAYKIQGTNECVTSCPTYYSADTQNKVCGLDTSSLLTYVNDSAAVSNGCSYNQYWSGSACQSCDSSCLTCSGGASTNCLSCPLGKYLNSNSCLACDSTHMVVGSSGACVETCGKSLNFGLLACDNGGAAGCTDCTVAQFYTCENGTTTTPDVCTYTTPTWSSLRVTDNNNLFAYFDREMRAVSNITSSTFTITITKSGGGSFTNFAWSVPSTYYTQYGASESARYIYIELTINEELEADAAISLTYAGSGVFRDTNNVDLSTTNSATGKLKANFEEITSLDKIVVRMFGSLTSILISVAIFVPMILGFKNGSREGMVLSVFGIQAMFYTSLINVSHNANFLGFMQFLRVFSLELDILPNFLTKMMSQSSRTSDLLTYDDLNFYKISNMIQFASLKLFILFIFGLICAIISLCPLCYKSKVKKKRLNKLQHFLIFNMFICIFFLMFCTLGYTAFAEVENIERTSPYKIVSVSTTFLFIMVLFLFVISIVKTVQTTPIQTDDLSKSRFNMLQAGMKPKKRSLLFYPILMAKMILIMILTVILNDDYKTLGFLLGVICCLSLGALSYLSPFVKVHGTKCFKGHLAYSLTIISEILFLLFAWFIVQYDPKTPSRMYIIGYCQICTAFLFSIFCCILGPMSSYKFMVLQNYESSSKVYLKNNADKEEAKLAKEKYETIKNDENPIEQNEEEEVDAEYEEEEEEEEIEDESDNENHNQNQNDVDEAENDKKDKKKSKRTKGVVEFNGNNLFNEGLESQRTNNKEEDKEEFEEVWVEEDE